MLTKEKLNATILEAERFLEKAKACTCSNYHSRQNSSVKRAAYDLSASCAALNRAGR